MDLGVHLLPREKYGVPGNIDVSVVIAHRGSGMGLWFTIESCDEALKDSGLNYEFIVVANGEEKTTCRCTSFTPPNVCFR